MLIFSGAILGKVDGAWHLLASSPMDINANQCRIKIATKGSEMKAYVDNMITPVITITCIVYGEDFYKKIATP